MIYLYHVRNNFNKCGSSGSSTTVPTSTTDKPPPPVPQQILTPSPVRKKRAKEVAADKLQKTIECLEAAMNKPSFKNVTKDTQNTMCKQLDLLYKKRWEHFSAEEESPRAPT